MKIKICGINSVELAKKICVLDIDALGLLVGLPQSQAPNYVTKEIAREVAKIAEIYCKDTFVLTKETDAKSIITQCKPIGNTHVQLLTDLSKVQIELIKAKLPHLQTVKVIHVESESAISKAAEYDSCAFVDQILLDSRTENKLGGTGLTHDWNISREIVRNCTKPVWLAGGLTPDNLKKAITVVNPYGVDVETGVQNPDGTKDFEKIGEFIRICSMFEV